MPRGTYFFTYGLPAASSRCLAIVRKRPLDLGTLLGSSLRLGHSCEPDGSRLLRRLRDQKSKQKSRRECDSPFPTPVGSENRTFPGQQSLPVLRHQCKKPGVLFKPIIKISFRVSGRAGRLPLGRPAIRRFTRRKLRPLPGVRTLKNRQFVYSKATDYGNGVITTRPECPAVPCLRWGRLRSTRPKGCKASPCHLTILLIVRRVAVIPELLLAQGWWGYPKPEKGRPLSWAETGPNRCYEDLRIARSGEAEPPFPALSRPDSRAGR